MNGSLSVIGVGNRDRGDDGAGAEVAARCGGRVVGGDLAGLGWCWEPDDDVVVVDTMVSGAPPGTVRWLTVDEVGTLRRGVSTHGIGVAEGLALAAECGRLPARLRIVGIEGVCFEPGAALSPPVRLAVEELERVLGPDGEVTPPGACGGWRSSA